MVVGFAGAFDDQGHMGADYRGKLAYRRRDPWFFVCCGRNIDNGESVGERSRKAVAVRRHGASAHVETRCAGGWSCYAIYATH